MKKKKNHLYYYPLLNNLSLSIIFITKAGWCRMMQITRKFLYDPLEKKGEFTSSKNIRIGLMKKNVGRKLVMDLRKGSQVCPSLG